MIIMSQNVKNLKTWQFALILVALFVGGAMIEATFPIFGRIIGDDCCGTTVTFSIEDSFYITVVDDTGMLEYKNRSYNVNALAFEGFKMDMEFLKILDYIMADNCVNFSNIDQINAITGTTSYASEVSMFFWSDTFEPFGDPSSDSDLRGKSKVYCSADILVLFYMVAFEYMGSQEYVSFTFEEYIDFMDLIDSGALVCQEDIEDVPFIYGCNNHFDIKGMTYNVTDSYESELYIELNGVDYTLLGEGMII